MHPQDHHVEDFLAAVRRRKNRHRLWNTMLWAVIAGAALLVVVGLCYVFRGYAVPSQWIGSIVCAVVLCSVAVWLMRRLNIERAAEYTDRFFGLQDSVSSYLHFSAHGFHDGYYALQAQQTADRVAGLDTAKIRYEPPRRLFCIAAGLLAVAIPVSMWPTSDEVLERLEMEQIVRQETTEINEKLAKEVEEAIKAAKDENESKLIEPNKLRRWVEELKSTPDRTEALRQYARLEANLRKAQLALQRKKDEQLLDRMAKELEKGEETKAMAETLQQKQYDKAAEGLKKLQPKSAKSPDQKRRDMARLKSLSQRMAAAVQAAKPPAKNRLSSKGNSSGNPNSSKQGGQGEGASGSKEDPANGEAGEAGESELAEMVEELAESLKECEACKDPKDCEKCEIGVCKECDKIGDKLKKLAICRRADSRLSKLCKKCSECQSNMACSSPNAGGHKAGWGTNTARRDQRDKLVDNGQTTQLKGVKGSGPSLTTVEAAEDGSGVSNRKAAARQHNFQRQFESFVQREDVPETVRGGVKQYFQIIHESDTAKPTKGNASE